MTTTKKDPADKANQGVQEMDASMVGTPMETVGVELF